LATAVKAVGADVMTQVCFARGGLDSDAWHIQGIVRTVHTALGGRLFVLLNSHGGSLEAVEAAPMKTQLLVDGMSPFEWSEAIDYTPSQVRIGEPSL
jgi:hypothetical protein